MTRDQAESVPMHSTVHHKGNGAGAGLDPHSHSGFRELGTLEKALREVGKLKEQLTKQGRVLVRLRANLVAVEDSYLEQETVLEELSAVLSNENDTHRAALDAQMHEVTKKKKRRHVAGATIALGVEHEVNEVAENATGIYNQEARDESGEETTYRIPNNLRKTALVSELSDDADPPASPVKDATVGSNGNAHESDAGHPSARKETWESYTDNINAFQQPAPLKRKQTARRSQPHIGRTKSLSSRKPKPDVSPTPKGHLSKPSSSTPPDAITSAQYNLEDEEMNSLPLRQIESPNIRALKQEINSLPPPPRMNIPNEPRTFSNTLLTSSLGGNQFTFAKVGSAMLRKQIFGCPEMIKVNPEMHEHAPLTGQHGALTMAYGKEGSGELGKIYPVFRKNKHGWEYAGEYKVAKRVDVPVAVWKKWSSDTRLAVAHAVDRSVWGQNLLLEKGLAEDDDALQKIKVEDILEFFEKSDEPNLRMAWTLLQCVGYVREKHDILAEKQDEELGSLPGSGALSDRHSPASRSNFKSKQLAQNHKTSTPNRAMQVSKKRRTRQSTASSDSEDYTRNSKRLCQDSGTSNRRTPNLDYATPDPNLNPVPLDELDEERVAYSSRGRRTKDIDYRIMNTHLDYIIFRDDGSDET